MNFKEIYKQKLISIPEAVALVQSNQVVATSIIGSEPPGLLGELGNHKDRLENVSVYVCLPMRPHSYMMQEDMAGHFNVCSWFYSQKERDLHSSGRISYCPNNLHTAATLILNEHKNHINVFFGIATPPDEKGYMSLSLGLIVEKQLMEAADLVILEINENLPFTYGDTHVHITDVDYVVENNFALPELPGEKPEKWQETIGGYIAEMIEDGSTLQLGIGGIPNAITPYLTARRDIGIHTEMFVDGFLDLIDAGAISGKKKTLWKEKMICTFALGSRRLYDFIDRNMAVEVHQGRVVNDPFVIAQNYKMMSVNTAIAIDITGQVCSQSIGHKHYSGTGGQLDFHIGAQKSNGGRGIIALRSTAKGGTVSTITPTLPIGSEITIPNQYIDTIVTEFGVADLKGKTIKQRMEALIKVAHPDFREWIRDEAARIGMVPRLVLPAGYNIARESCAEACPVVPGVTQEKIKIGTMLDLSGSHSNMGLEMLHGINALFEHINSAKGGIHGRKLQLVVEDHGFDPERGKVCARRLVEDDQVFAILAPLGTPINLAVKDYFIGHRIPIVAPMSGIAEWSNPLIPTYFAFQTSYQVEGRILAQYAVEHLLPKSVVIYAIDDLAGREGSESATAEFKRLGLDNVRTVFHRLDEPDMNACLTRIRAEGDPDLVLLSTYVKPAANILLAADEAGFRPEWLGSAVISGPGLFKQASPRATNGVRTGCYPPGPNFHRGDRLYRRNMKQSYDDLELGTYSAVAYAAAQVMLEAIRNAGCNLSRESFIHQMEQLKEFSGGVFPPISYSPTDHRGLKVLSIQRAIGGKWLREKACYELKE